MPKQMPQASGPRLLSTPEAAAYLSVSYSTIDRMLVTGQLPVIRHFKHRRIDRNDLDAWIERQKELL